MMGFAALYPSYEIAQLPASMYCPETHPMIQPSQFSLFTQRRFGPFFWTQFFGAFNDNVFKTALMTILTYDALSWTAMDAGLLNNLIPGLFNRPASIAVQLNAS